MCAQRPFKFPRPFKMNILSMIGESVSRMVSDAAKSNDGSYIGVQTSKGHYTGGEMLSGFVVLQNNSVRQVDRVLLKVTIKERTYWDEEIAHTRSEGEGDNRKTWTEYQHFARQSKVTHCKDCLLYTSPSPRDRTRSRMPSSA